MRHTRPLALIALVIIPLLAGCGSNSSAPAPTATVVLSPTPVPSATTAPGGTIVGGACRAAATDGNGGPYPAEVSSDCTGKKAVEVDVISDPKSIGGFSPSNITISKGATVTWVWKSGGHNLAPFHTGIEDTGYSFRKTFNQPGTYHYQCQVHPGQNGLLIVQ